MAVEKITIERFLQMSENYPVFDVRSPAEYGHAHIPGAYSLPLFSDEERKVVGTTYKQKSREDAIKTGLDYFGPKMKKMVNEVESVLNSPEYVLKSEGRHTLLVHCWRGGMRSAAIAWLLDLYGFKVFTLAGGYKKFRNFVGELFSLSYQFNILGGYTGSGKTILLKELERAGHPVVDLEEIAHHKGSAFGAINEPPQPTQEMFENRLAKALYDAFRISRLRLYEEKPEKIFIENESGNPLRIWIEDESQRIGNVNLPNDLWGVMRKSPVFFIDIPFEERLEHLVTGYGQLDKEKMINAILRIKKRLGGLETKTAVNYLIEDNCRDSFRVLLTYYDKHYLKGLQNRENSYYQITTIKCNKVDIIHNARLLLREVKPETEKELIKKR